MSGEDREYVEFVRRQPCRMRMNDPCEGLVQAHHAGERGLGQRAHDRTCIPLCARHHGCWHDANGPYKTWDKKKRAAWAEQQIKFIQSLFDNRGYEAVIEDGVGVGRINLEALVPDVRNANRGTPRGNAMLAASVQQFGAARSIVIDRFGCIIAGNKTHEALCDAGITDAIVVETDGRRPVVVQRTDLDLADVRGSARRLAYADNRTNETDLSWDPAQVLADQGLVSFDGLFTGSEIADIIAGGIEETDGAKLLDPQSDACQHADDAVVQIVPSMPNWPAPSTTDAVVYAREAAVLWCRRCGAIGRADGRLMDVRRPDGDVPRGSMRRPKETT